MKNLLHYVSTNCNQNKVWVVVVIHEQPWVLSFPKGIAETRRDNSVELTKHFCSVLKGTSDRYKNENLKSRFSLWTSPSIERTIVDLS